MHNVVVVVSGSFLRACESAVSTRIVLDPHMGFQKPFQSTTIGKFLAAMFARFFGRFKLFLFLLCEGTLVDLMSQDVSLKTFTLDETFTTLVTPEGSFASVYLHMLVQYLLPHKTFEGWTSGEEFGVIRGLC